MNVRDAVVSGPLLVFIWSTWCEVSLPGQDLSQFIPLCRSDRTPGIALGDVNGDGRLDIVFGNGRHTPQPNLVYVNGNRTDLFFLPRPLGNSATYSVVLADLDRDGDLDLVEGNDYGFWNVIWMNDGRGNLSSDYYFGVDDRTRELAVGDVTGDGFPDIIAANFVVAPGDTSKVYVNDGTGRVPEGRPLPVGEADAAAVALGDFNGDKHLDIVLGTLAGHPDYLYLNDGTGRFPRAMPFGPRDDDSDGIAVGDLDRDGHLDVVVGNTGQQNRIVFGDGKGGFSRSVTFGGRTDRTRAVAIGDIDGDGNSDVVVGYESRDAFQTGGDGTIPTSESRGQVLFLYRLRNEVNQVYLNDGRGNLRPGPTFGAPGVPTRAIALGDVDGDGRLDIVVGNDCTENAIYLNRKLLSR
jgi:hypothetical protein